MSDQARNYVKTLDLPWSLKAVLFLLADYHNVKDGCAWPGLDTLAEVMGKNERNVKRLIRQLESTGKFQYVAGLGRGNRGRFYFLDLGNAVTRDLFPETEKAVIKAVTKEVISNSVIRKNHEPLTNTSLPNPPSQGGNGSSKFKISRRDHSRIARWVEKADRPNDIGQGSLRDKFWNDIVRAACLDLMIPFEDAKHDLVLMDEAWRARLEIKKESGSEYASA